VHATTQIYFSKHILCKKKYIEKTTVLPPKKFPIDFLHLYSVKSPRKVSIYIIEITKYHARKTKEKNQAKNSRLQKKKLDGSKQKKIERPKKSYS
jgi:hypothetical protein